jgi:hypothetical protein
LWNRAIIRINSVPLAPERSNIFSVIPLPLSCF